MYRLGGCGEFTSRSEWHGYNGTVDLIEASMVESELQRHIECFTEGSGKAVSRGCCFAGSGVRAEAG